MTQSNLETHLNNALGKMHNASSDFDLNPDANLPKNRVLRPAAVLVAIEENINAPRIILTRRASSLKHHPGQIAFPGGKREDSDGSIEQTALREAYEEIGLLPKTVQILGRMPSHETVTGFTITPILALVRARFNPDPDHNEVAEVFTTPLSHICDTAQYSIQSRHWRRGRRHYYTVPYGPYYIWGATARILKSLAEGARE